MDDQALPLLVGLFVSQAIPQCIRAYQGVSWRTVDYRVYFRLRSASHDYRKGCSRLFSVDER